MDEKTLAEAADPDVLAQYLAELPAPAHSHGADQRLDEYKGHRILIETHYVITVDGKPVPSHLGVGQDGSVHSHDLPPYEFASAVDAVRVLIDVYPDEFPPPDGHDGDHGEPKQGDEPHAHPHDHEHGG
jgi:hypothetical protein